MFHRPAIYPASSDRVDFLRNAAASADDRCKRRRIAPIRRLLQLLEKTDDFHKRNLPPTAGRLDGRDLPLTNQAVKRSLTDSEEASCFGATNRGSRDAFQVVQNRLDLVAYALRSVALEPTEPKWITTGRTCAGLGGFTFVLQGLRLGDAG